MKAKLGDTVNFTYTGPNVTDKNPQIFFLARVGNIVHGLNQHYQTPREKYYYFIVLKNIFFNQIKTGKLSPIDFYKQYVRHRLITNSYRKYKFAQISNVKIVPIGLFTFSNRVDVRTPFVKFKSFLKGEKVRFVSMVKNKLYWTTGEIIGRKVPGANYLVKTSAGEVVQRHPSDLKPIT